MAAPKSADTGLRTFQLREYQIEDGGLATFFSFWSERIVPVREAFGFRLEWYYSDLESSRFFWMVSAPGDEAEFARRQDHYNGSPERAQTFSELSHDPVKKARTVIVNRPAARTPFQEE